MKRTTRFGIARLVAATFLILLGTIPASATIPQSEHDALMALYNATGGAMWTTKDGWGGALGSENTWWGVTLNGDETGVVVLQLYDNNLNGTLPPEIGGLSQLTYLDVSSNKIHGDLPTQLGSLSNLERLYLNQNQFTGALPSALGSLTKLKYLHLNGNVFAGAIPSQFQSLVNLISNAETGTGGLDLRYNALFTSDATLKSFLDSKQNGGNWWDTQTLAPTGLTVDNTTQSTVDFSWNTIGYSGDDGGYKVFMSSAAGGPYTLNQTTPDKLTNSATITGLTNETTYYFVVQTFTSPHPPINTNTVTSAYSAELSARTGTTPLTASAASSATSGTAPFTVSFYATVSGGTSPYSYQWGFGDGTTSTEANPTHTYATAGNFSVTLTVTDSSSPAQTASDGHITVNVTSSGALTASSSANPTSGQAPLAVSFTSTVSGGTAPYAYLWTFGDGNTAGTQNASHTYTAGGAFSATLKVTDSSTPPVSFTTPAISITVTGQCTLTCTATVPAAGTAGQEISFTGQATPTACTGTPSYAWSFGDGSVSTEQNPKHTYATEGVFTWSLGTAIQDKTCTKTGSIAIVTPPTISSLAKLGNPFRIVINGFNFKTGVKVFINGTEWTNVQMKSTVKLVLKGGSGLKAVVPKNTATQFKVQNPDGGEASMTWQWP